MTAAPTPGAIEGPDLPATMAQVLADPCGLAGCVSGEVFAGALLLVIAAAVAIVFFFWRRWTRELARRDSAVIDERDWIALTSLHDGTIGNWNVKAARAGIGPGGIGDDLPSLIGVNETEIYRLARAAIRDGLAIMTFAECDAEARGGLVVQPTGANRLLWQVMPGEHLVQVLPEGRQRDFDGLPVAYIRIDPIDGPETNTLFRDVFSELAIEMLCEQVDQGIFTAGRVILPGARGADRLALSAVRIEKTPMGDQCEIFLFVPDTETVSEVSAAETLDAVPVSLLQLDVEGRVLWANHQAREMLGSAFEVGTLLGDIAKPLSRSLDNLLEEIRSGESNAAGEMVRLLEGDDRFAQVTLTRMTLMGQPSLIAVLTDASELRLLEDKFAQSQKMEAVGKLAGGVAHDFNNVLTAISGHCDLLLLRKDASHPDFSDLTQIRQNSNRAATLVRQLLAFSRKQTLQPRTLSVQDVVTDTLYLLDRLIGERTTLSLDLGRDIGSVQADHQQLEQALMNLVVNARDAMPEGGIITIATRSRLVQVEEQRRGIVIPPGEYVEICVSDNGTGIDEKHIDKVFDPFYTTKPQGEGTGLGLSTVYGIVKQSGGYIYVENIASGGAGFTVLLPRADRFGEAPPPEPEAEKSAADQTGQGAVMLVEDEAPVRSFASRALKLRGYKVIEAESAEDAMDYLNGTSDAIDVLVSDVMMPGMDGPTFATEARKIRPDMRVIFISGYAEDSFRRNLKDDDFLFLPKPFSLNELTAKVKLAMEQMH